MRTHHEPPPADSDPWLERWRPLLGDPQRQPRVLELGCSSGRDTAWLTRNGYRPVSLDISAEALRECARNAPQAMLLQHDLQNPLPFADGHFDIVIAALCLHYFEWRKTLDIVAEIRRCSAGGAHMLCRLNSTRDFHHGAAGGAAIEPNFYRIDGRYSEKKRFFDRAAVEALFADGWEFLALDELTIDRYDKPKAIWEMALRKS